jgi:hypothetical protein
MRHVVRAMDQAHVRILELESIIFFQKSCGMNSLSEESELPRKIGEALLESLGPELRCGTVVQLVTSANCRGN